MNYMYPPPWWGNSGGPPNRNNMSKRELDKIARQAVREAMRLRDHDKNSKRKRQEERRKKSSELWKKVMNFIYIFCLGLLLHPVVGPLVNHLSNYLNAK